MESTNGSQHFEVSLELDKLRAQAEEVKGMLRTMGGTAEQEGSRMDAVMKKLAGAAAGVFSTGMAVNFAKQVANVRGEFQQLEVAFTTMLQSADKAQALMEQLTQTAATTPFGLQDVAGGAKQLLAYGVAAEDVNETLVRLGDIAAGLSIPLNDLVYLYGTTMTQGRLFTQDLRQFMGRGIPIAEELAKQFGVTKDQVGELVTAGKVGFPEVKKAIEAMTDAGGKFGGLMDAQSKTITGQISNLQDSISMMFNEIGQKSEGIISGAIGAVSSLVENYQKVGKFLAELIGTYGVYKVSLMAITAAMKVHNTITAQAAIQTALAAKQNITLSASQARAAATTTLLSGATKKLSAALTANPYVLAATAVAGLGIGLYKLITYQTDAEKAQNKLNKAVAESDAASATEISTLARLKGELSALTKGTDEYNSVKDKIVKQFGQYYDGLADEIEQVGLTEKAYKSLTEAIMQSYGARQYEKFAAQQSEELETTISDNLAKIQERLYKKLGDEEGANIYTKLMSGIFDGSIGIGQGIGELTGLTDDLQQALDKAAGASGKNFDIANRAVEGYIKNIITARQLTEQTDKQARERFGITGDTGTGSGTDGGGTGTDTQKETKNKAYWEKQAKDSQDQLDALEVTELNTEKAAELRKKIAEAQAMLASYDTKSSSAKTGSAASSGASDLATAQAAYDKKRAEQARQAEFDIAQARIDGMQDGLEKELAQNRLNYDRMLEENRKREEQMVENLRDLKEAEWNAANTNAKAQGKSFDRSSVTAADVSDADKDTLKGYADAYGEAFIDANGRAYVAYQKQLEDMLSEFRTYEQKREAIQKEYAGYREALYDEEGNLRVGVTQENLDNINKAETESLKALENEQAEAAMKSSDLLVSLFTGAGEMSRKEIDDTISKTEQLLDYLKNTDSADITAGFGFTAEQLRNLKASPDQIKAITEALERLKEAADTDPFTALSNAIKNIAQDGATEAEFKALAEALSGVAGQAGSLAGDLSGMFDALGNDKASGAASAIGEVAGSVGNVASGFAKGGLVGGIAAAAGEAIKWVTKLAKAHDEKLQKSIENTQKKIDALSDAYEDLDDVVGDQFGASAARTMDQMNANLEKQIALIEQQKQAEKDKKKTDNDAVDEYTKKQEELRKQIDENKEAQLDAILGEDIQSAISAFADAMADAWANGTDAADTAKDQAKRMMKQMLSEAVKDYIEASGKMEAIREKMKGYLADNFFSDAEKEAMQRDLENMYNDVDRVFGRNEDIYKDEEATEMQNAGTAGGFETMSQDVATELNGRFTALQIAGETCANQAVIVSDTLANMRNLMTASNSTLTEMLNLHMQEVGHLEDIAKQTKNLPSMVEKIEKMERNISKL